MCTKIFILEYILNWLAFLALGKQKSVSGKGSVAINHDLEQLDFSKVL